MLFLLGIAAIGVFTVCFVWAMESVSGRWKTFIGMTMNYAWPIGRYEKKKDTSIAWKKSTMIVENEKSIYRVTQIKISDFKWLHL